MLYIIYCFSLLLNENDGNNRHTVNLIDEPAFKRFLNKVYLPLMMLPHLEEFPYYFEKIFWRMIKSSNYHTNVYMKSFIETISKEATQLFKVSKNPIFAL